MDWRGGEGLNLWRISSPASLVTTRHFCAAAILGRRGLCLLPLDCHVAMLLALTSFLRHPQIYSCA